MVVYFSSNSTSTSISASIIGVGYAISSIAGLVGAFVSGYLLDKSIGWRKLFSVAGIIQASAVVFLSEQNSVSFFFILFMFLGFASGMFGPAGDIAIDRSRLVKTSRGMAFTQWRFTESVITIFIFIIMIIMVSTGIPAKIFTLAGITTIIAVVLIFNLDLGSDVDVQRVSKYSSYDHEGSRILNFAQNVLSIFDGPLVVARGIKALLNRQFIYIIVLLLIFHAILILENSAMPVDFAKIGITSSGNSLVLILIFLALRNFVFGLVLLPIGTKYSKLPSKKGFQFGFSMYFVAMMILSLSLNAKLFDIPLSPLLFILIIQIFSALANAALMPTSTRAVLESVEKKRHGVALSFMNFAMAVANAIVTVIGGYFLEKNQDSYFWLVVALFCITALPIAGRLSVQTKNS